MKKIITKPNSVLNIVDDILMVISNNIDGKESRKLFLNTYTKSDPEILEYIDLSNTSMYLFSSLVNGDLHSKGDLKIEVSPENVKVSTMTFNIYYDNSNEDSTTEYCDVINIKKSDYTILLMLLNRLSCLVAKEADYE